MSTRKWLEIVRFELAYQLTRRSTWIIFGVLLFPLFGQTNGQSLQALEEGVLYYAPLFMAQSALGMGLILLPLMAAIVGEAATRDVQTRVEPLMHASSAGRAAYFGGRFLGAFLVCALLLLAVPLFYLSGPLFLPRLEPQFVGPLDPIAPLQAFLLLVLPNAFVAAALMFALATLMRHTLGSYLGAFLIGASAIVTTQVVGRVTGNWGLATLLNPVGHSSLTVMADTWSPGDLNRRLVGLDGGLLWNRLLMLGLALGLLAFTYTRFRYGGGGLSARWWQRGRAASAARAQVEPEVGARAPVVAVPSAARSFDRSSRLRQTLSIARDSFREAATGLKWVAPPLLALQLLLASEGLRIRGTPTFATTARVLEALYSGPPPIVGAVFFFVILFAGELVWRERDASLHALSDATPVPNGVRFAGKVLGLWLSILALHAVLMLAGVTIQLLHGSHDIDLALYLQHLFGLQLPGLLAFALLVLSLHVLVNQKHVGHIAVVALMVGAINLAGWLGIEHPLLSPFEAPGWRYSPISGFGPSVGPFLWLKTYWAGWSLLFALIAALFWVRGAETGVRDRFRIARGRLRGRTLRAIAAVLAVVLVVGGFVFYNTNVLNEYRSSRDDADRAAQYERRYGALEGAPQPRIVGTTLNVELYPERRAAEIRGTYELVNRTSRPIDTIHVAVSLEAETGELEFDRTARALVVDDELRQRLYVLDQPLQPGEPLRMSWRVVHEPRGFRSDGISTAVVANGSFIETWAWLPQIGYQSGRELTSPVERRSHGLDERVAIPSLDDAAARNDPDRHARTDLDVTIGTAADQIAVAPGELRRSWTQDGRRYFRYVTDAPIGPGYALFSAEYAVRAERADGIALEIVYHPAHDANVERMMRSMQRSVAQFTRRFGPYPYRTLRLIEWPGEGAGGAHAASGAVWYEAVFSLFDPDHDERDIDLPFAVVAHETAHQFQVVPAPVEGIALLSESFAWYAALGVIEEEYGPDHLERFLDFMREDELTPRSRADVPLLRASDWYLAYRKGPFAMYALREYLGQDSVDLAWRRLIARHASNEPPYATSLDLYRELQQVTPDSLQYLLGDLLERNTFWELEARGASSRPMADGRWQVSLEVVARKVAVDTAGAETGMPMNDLIEIGAFGPATAESTRGEPLHLALHRIRTGTQTITFTVPRRPVTAGIDPRHLLIDVTPADNTLAIADASPASD